MNLCEVLQSADWSALVVGRCPPAVRADYLRDRGAGEQVVEECYTRPPFHWFDVWRFMGRGSGIGSGIGSGRGSGSGIYPETGVMRIGQSYLVHLGDWHTFIGRVCDQLGPLTYEMEFASKVDIQNFGDRWHDLCAGDADLRAGATYWHQPGKVVIPLSIVAMEWAGDLPHPDAPKQEQATAAKRRE